MAYHFLFDYDGVLVQKLDFAKSLAERHGTDEVGLRSFFQKHLRDCLIGKADMIECLSPYLNSLHWEGSSAALFEAIYLEDISYQAETIALIKQRLHGVFPCHIATNQDSHRYQSIVQEPLSKELFEKVFSSSEFGVAKPDIEYFEQMYVHLSQRNPALKKEELVFIDDLPENIESASRFGLKTHLYQHHAGFQAFLLDLLPRIQVPTLQQGEIQLQMMENSHAKGYSEILSEPGTYQFLTDSGPKNEAQALQKIKGNQQASLEGNSLYWSIVNREQAFMGFIAAHNLKDEKVSISYGIHPACRRRGVATAALQMVLTWHGLGGKLVEMATHLENEVSFQMLTNIGLSYHGVTETPFGQRHVFTNGKADSA